MVGQAMMRLWTRYTPWGGGGGVAIVVALAVGCTHEMVRTPNPTPIDRTEFSRMYHAAVHVLREYGFRIDRQSHRFGLISTKYLPCPAIFEPWHTADTTSQQAWENTLNQQRRCAIVSLEPGPVVTDANPQTTSSQAHDSRYRLRVEVLIERRQHPNRYLTGSTNGHRVYGTLLSTPEEWLARGIEGSYWRPVGRDTLLEQHLLANIIRKSLLLEPTEP